MLVGVLLWSLSCGIQAAIPGQGIDHARLITFGTAANPKDGDVDHRQSVYIAVPKEYAGELYLRLFDPDVGDRHDELIGEWDGGTRFRLIGGAFDPTPELPAHSGKPAAPTAAEAPAEKGEVVEADASLQVIAEKEYGRDQLLDGLWVNLTSFKPEQGLDQGDHWLFRLDAQGITGDDGNVYDVAVSSDPKKNTLPKGVEVFSYLPTVHVPPMAGYFGEVRFFVPKGMSQVQVHNYDLEKASVRLQTPFRTLDEVTSSQSGAWVMDQIELSADEQGTMNAISLETSKTAVNDATFFVTGVDGEPLRLYLPFLLRRENHRPMVYMNTTVLKDCRTVVFDATGTVDPDGDELTYAWDFGIEQGSGNPISFTYPEPGQYIGRLLVHDDAGVVGNSAKAVIAVTLNQPPIAVMEPVAPNVPGTEVWFDARGSTDPDGEINHYQWNFGDGSRGEGSQVKHTYRQPGVYKVKLQVRDDSQSPCALDTAQADVWINSPPVIEAGKDRRGAIAEELVMAPERVYDADNEIELFHWEFGDDTTGEGRQVSHAYAKAGRYQVKVTVDDGSGTANSQASDGFVVIVNDPPIPDAGPDHRVAAGEPIAFDGSRSKDNDGKLIAYHWDFGDGSEADGVRVSHAYGAPGVYTATLATTDDSGTLNATVEDTAQVIINFPPVADAGEDQRVNRSVVEFDAGRSSDQDGEIIAYRWDFGDGRTGEGRRVSHVYGNPGRYAVTLSVTDDSKTSTDTTSDGLEVVVNANPVADAGLPLQGAPGQQLTFDGSASVDPDGKISGYRWWFDDGSVEDGVRATHSYRQPGRYHVRLQVKDDSGHEDAVDDASVEVVINAPPQPRVAAPSVMAPGDELTLRASGSLDPDGEIVRYHWEFDDGAPPLEGMEVSRRFERPGTWYATLTVDDGSGVPNSQAQARVAVRVNHRPVALPGPDQHTCANLIGFDGSASADNDGDPLRYLWDFGDGTTGEGMRVDHNYIQGGVYPVTLTVEDGRGLENSRHSASLVVTINQSPVADAGDDATVCAGEVMAFNGARSVDPKGRFLKYHWDFGDGGDGDGVSPTRIYRTGGVFQVQLMVEDDTGLECGRAVDRMVLRVVESPIADAGPDLEVCANSEVRFDGSGSRDQDGLVNAFSWDFGDGGQGGGPNPTHIFAEPGAYQVRLTIKGDQVGSCDNSDVDTLNVLVHSAPQAEIDGPAGAAVGEKLAFDGSRSSSRGQPITEWAWDFGDGDSAKGAQVNHTYAEPGRYFVELKVTTGGNSGCNTTSQRQVVVVNAAPTAALKMEQVGAVNQELWFDGAASTGAGGVIRRYDWDFGDGEQLQGVQVRHRYRNPGSYQVRLTVTDDSGRSNATAEATQELRINASPEPVIDAPLVGCPGTSVTFDGKGSSDTDGTIHSYRWQFGDGATAEGEGVSHTYRDSGEYQVTLELEDDSGVVNARHSASRSLRINASPLVEGLFQHMACPGEKIEFDASRSRDPDGEIVAHRWHFGDGSEAVGPTVSHTFESPGRYKVRLLADDGTGVSCSTAEQERLIVINTPPSAHVDAEQEVKVGGAHDAVLFDASGSEDADGDPLLYRWDFGDGAVGEGIRVWHNFRIPGEYLVRLTVSDSTRSGCATATDQVTVKAVAR